MRRTTLPVAAAAALLCAPLPAIAQDRADEQRQSIRETLGAITFSFDGGNAAEYADAVREASGRKNVVIMPGVDAFHMPPVELRDVSVEGALAALRFARPIEEDELGRARIDVGREADVFVIVAQFADELAHAARAERETAVFSLAEMLETGEVAPADVLTAVETALALSESGEPAMRYHPETRLLIVRAPRTELEAVEMVLRGVEHSAGVMRAGAEEAEDVRREIEETRVALEAARRAVDEAAKYADQVEQLAEQGGAGPLDVLEAREAMIQRERKRAELESHLHLLEQRLERQRRHAGDNEAHMAH